VATAVVVEAVVAEEDAAAADIAADATAAVVETLEDQVKRVDHPLAHLKAAAVDAGLAAVVAVEQIPVAVVVDRQVTALDVTPAIAVEALAAAHAETPE
jgi:hypothetical protein